MEAKLKAAVTLELIGSFLLALLPGLFYISDSYRQNIIDKAEKISYARDGAIVTAGLTAGLTFISYAISGAMFSPVITVALMVVKRVDLFRGICSIAAQLAGSLIAGVAIYYMIPQVISDPNKNGLLMNLPMPDTYNNQFMPASNTATALIVGEGIATSILLFGYFVAAI